jgi:hypothetical protein
MPQGISFLHAFPQEGHGLHGIFELFQYQMRYLVSGLIKILACN